MTQPLLDALPEDKEVEREEEQEVGTGIGSELCGGEGVAETVKEVRKEGV